MGNYDSIFHQLKCPVNEKVEEREIQVKWAGCMLDDYKVGDEIPLSDILSGEDIWIKNSYVCSNCPDQQPAIFHPAYIHLEKSRIVEILSEEEFSKKGLKFLEGLTAAIMSADDGI